MNGLTIDGEVVYVIENEATLRSIKICTRLKITQTLRSCSRNWQGIVYKNFWGVHKLCFGKYCCGECSHGPVPCLPHKRITGRQTKVYMRESTNLQVLSDSCRPILPIKSLVILFAKMCSPTINRWTPDSWTGDHNNRNVFTRLHSADTVT